MTRLVILLILLGNFCYGEIKEIYGVSFAIESLRLLSGDNYELKVLSKTPFIVKKDAIAAKIAQEYFSSLEASVGEEKATIFLKRALKARDLSAAALAYTYLVRLAIKSGTLNKSLAQLTKDLSSFPESGRLFLILLQTQEIYPEAYNIYARIFLEIHAKHPGWLLTVKERVIREMSISTIERGLESLSAIALINRDFTEVQNIFVVNQQLVGKEGNSRFLNHLKNFNLSGDYVEELKAFIKALNSNSNTMGVTDNINREIALILPIILESIVKESEGKNFDKAFELIISIPEVSRTPQFFTVVKNVIVNANLHSNFISLTPKVVPTLLDMSSSSESIASNFGRSITVNLERLIESNQVDEVERLLLTLDKLGLESGRSDFETASYAFTLKAIKRSGALGTLSALRERKYFAGFWNNLSWWDRVTLGVNRITFCLSILGLLTIGIGIFTFFWWKRLTKLKERDIDDDFFDELAKEYKGERLRARFSRLTTPSDGKRVDKEPRQEDLDLLGLERGASLNEIKSAYRALIKKAHPDKNKSVSHAVATERFMMIKEAYKRLTTSN